MKKVWQLAIYLLLGFIFSLAILIISQKSNWRTSIHLTEEQINPLVTAPLPTPIPPIKKIKLIFLGDMMFDRHIRKYARQNANYTYILEDFRSPFYQADLIIGNLEGPVTDNKSRSEGSVIGSTNNFIFTFEPAVLKMLKGYGKFLLNLGNNHIFNFGQNGLKETLDNLNQEEIAYFGFLGPVNGYYSHRIVDFSNQQQNFKIAFINYNQFIADSKLQTFTEIKLLKPQVDLVVVYPHWGIEYQTTANSAITTLAHQFVDAGADLVIGAHPHVVQQSEIYQGKYIYYSLGNFIFDQYFSPEVKKGLMLEAEIDPINKEIQIKEFQTQLELNGKTSLVK